MLTVAGPSPAVDITYVVDDYRLGQIHRPTTVARCAGGKALNMARAARQVGADVALTTILGGATGGWIAEELEAEGVATTVVPGSLDTRTCVSVASAATGTLTEVYEHAPDTPPALWARLCDGLDELLSRRPGWLSTSGSMPRQLPADTLAALVRLGRRRGVAVALDSHGAMLAPALDEGPDLVKVNRVEAAAALDADSDGDLGEMARALAGRTGGTVVLTDGAAGAVGWDGSRLVRAVLPDVHGDYPVGSGDSFLGGLLAGLDAGAGLAEALRTAIACGAANALVPGAARFDPAEVGRLAERVSIEGR